MFPNEPTLWQIFIKGGPLMWPILLCSIFFLAVLIERASFLYERY